MGNGTTAKRDGSCAYVRKLREDVRRAKDEKLPDGKKLPAPGKLTQGKLAKLAGVTTRTIRKWETEKPPKLTTRESIVRALAIELGRNDLELIAEVEALIDDEPTVAEARTEVRIPLPPSPPGDWLQALIAKALDGFLDGPSVYCFPSFLKHDAEGILFLVERHVLSPGLADLRAEHAVIQVPVVIEDGAASFRAPQPSTQEDPMQRLGALPFVGTPTLRSIRLDLGDASSALVGALVTPLCRERTLPAVPRLLSTVLQSGDDHPEPSREQLANWVELASSLTTAVWSLHAHDWVHFGVSADNVLVREDHGRWRDVTLINIDLRKGGDLRQNDPQERLSKQQEDFLGLRDTLVSALVGQAIDLGHDPGVLEAVREKVHGELARRALNLCLRHLVEIDPAAPRLETSTDRLRKLLHDLGALKALMRWKTARGSLMRGALPRAPARPQRKDGVVSALLVAIRESADDADRQAWCASYLRDDGSRPTDVDGCARLLAAGHGRSALEALSRVVREQSTTLSSRDIIRALRLLVGVLLSREGATDEAIQILDRYADHADAGVAWWVTLLRDKITDPHDPRRFERDSFPMFPGSDVGERRRAEPWRVAHLTLLYLARGKTPTGDQIHEIERLLHGDASHEAAFGALVLARALAFDRSLVGFRRAMSALQLAASYSAARGLPHEQAAALAITAAVVRGAFSDPGLRAKLSESGVDADESLVLAADCALLAAEMYQWLDVPTRSRKAYRAAAACFFGCAHTPEYVVEGFRWLGLSRNHRFLPWAPPDIDPSGRRAVTPSPPETQATRVDGEEREEHSAIAGAVERWRTVSQDIPGASAYLDPGSVLADNYSDLYGPGIEHVYRTGGATIELMRKGSDGSDEPAPGGVVRDLLVCAERWFGKSLRAGARVLQLRCGTGTEALILAREHELEVVGIDSSAWSIRSAQVRAEGVPNLRFQRAELLEVGAMKELQARFDVVLLHDSICQMICKRELLEGAARCLRDGGVVLGTEWIQSRTATRRHWQRLFETLWLPDLETREGCRRLLEEARFSKITIEPRDEEMRGFFDNRLAWLNIELGSLSSRGSEETAVLQRARTDIGALRRLCSDTGPLGWIRFGGLVSRD